MTKAQLKILGTIPQVISALNALAAEQAEMRSLMAGLSMPEPRRASEARVKLANSYTGGFGTKLPDIEPEPEFESVSEGSPDLDTPERREHLAAMEEKRATQRAYLDSIKAQRAALLSQFAKDGGSDEDAPVSVQPIPNISGS